MSRHAARNALDQMIGRPALIAPVCVPGTLHGFAVPGAEATSVAMLHDLRELAGADPIAEAALWEERKATLAAAYYPGIAQTQNKPFAFSNGVAIIPIHGTLINRFAGSYGYVTGYNFIKAQVAAAEADPEVTGIIYDVNSYGGMVSGCQETSDCIGEGLKRSMAVVDANCYSAAYMLASQADDIVSTPSGGIGSIGVVMMHVDLSKALKDFGVDVTFIYAGEHKVDGNMYEPLSDEVRAEFQAEIDACYDMFVAQVAFGRGLPEQDVRDTEARSYRAEDALGLGLIDAIQNPANAVEAFTKPKENAMPPATRTQSVPDPVALAAATEQARVDQEAASAQAAQTAATEAAATARTSERARIALIQGHPEAVGREALAAHLALQTDMTVEAAAGILAASPKTAEPQAQQGSAFQDAMNRGTHPNVGAGGGDGTQGDDGMTPAQKILASQARVEGKPATKH